MKSVASPIDLQQRTQQDQQAIKRRVVAIAADYDNCFDFIAPLGVENMKAWPFLAYWYPMPADDGLGWTFDGLAKLLETAIQSITDQRDEVTLFVGSARQSSAYDRSNAKRGQNGSCRKAYEIMAEERGWKLNRALLDDYSTCFQKPTAEYDTNWFLERIDQSGSKWDSKQRCKELPENQEKLKALIISNVAAQLLKTNPDDEIDLYFFDDRVELLEAAHEVKLPANIRLHTVWFDHYGFYTGDVEKKLHDSIPMPTRPHLTALRPDGCTEELLPPTLSAGEAVKAQMWKSEEPFVRKYGDKWQRISVAPSTCGISDCSSSSTTSSISTTCSDSCRDASFEHPTMITA
jgi:hypothetical protein